MASNMKERLHWTTRLQLRPDPDSNGGRWLRGVKDVQSEKDFIGITSFHSEKPEVVRCVRGFVAWKFGESTPEVNPPQQEQIS